MDGKKKVDASPNKKHTYTCPYSPHQNGAAERSCHTWFKMALALLIELKLPKFL